MSTGTEAKPAVSLCSYLDTKSFRGTALRSASVLLQQTALMAGWWLVAPRAESTAACVAAVVAWGLLVLRAYMIFHDCGHGSFFQGFPGAKTINWLTLHVSAMMCGTPTDWNVGHQLHHANVGNLDQDDYDWGETIFHTAAQYQALPPGKQAAWKFVRHPFFFFPMAPAATWYLKMRLPFELRPERKAAYRFGDKMLSTALMAGRYYAAHALGILPLVFAGDYLAMFTGVLLFHWQHVYESGYVRNGQEWKLRDASIKGSSIITVPEALKYFTLGIEYHHIHHFRTKIPGYKLREVHESAPASFSDMPEGFSCAVVLGARDMWRSVWLQCFDEASQKYATFDEVLRSRKTA